MRLPKQLLFLPVLSLLLVALFSSSALAKSTVATGRVLSVKTSQDRILLRTGKGRKARTLVATLASTARVSAKDRSRNGVAGLEDVKKGDQVKVTGTRKGNRIAASSLLDKSTLPKGDTNNDGVQDDLPVIEATGTITDFNADQRLLTVQIKDSEDETLNDTELSVALQDGATLIVGDRNRDHKRDWADVQNGDRISLLLLDPVDAQAGAQAVLMVDSSSLRGGKKPKPPVDQTPGETPMGGTLVSADSSTGMLTVQPPLLDSPTFDVLVNDQTDLESDDVNNDGIVDLQDLNAGDQLRMLVDNSDPNNLVAIKLRAHQEDDTPQPGDHSRPKLLIGSLATIDAASKALQVTIFGGGHNGDIINVKWDANTIWMGEDINNDGSVNQQDVAAGDRISVLTDGAAQPTAWRILDLGPGDFPSLPGFDDPFDSPDHHGGGDNNNPDHNPEDPSPDDQAPDHGPDHGHGHSS